MTASSSCAGRKKTTGPGAPVTVRRTLHRAMRVATFRPMRTADPVGPRPRAAGRGRWPSSPACSSDDGPPRRLLGPHRGPDRPAARAVRRGDRHQHRRPLRRLRRPRPAHRQGGRPLAGRRVHLAEPRRRRLPRRQGRLAAAAGRRARPGAPRAPRRRRHLGRALGPGAGPRLQHRRSSPRPTCPTRCSTSPAPDYEGQVAVAPTNGSFHDFVTAMRRSSATTWPSEWLTGMAANDARTYAEQHRHRRGGRPRRGRRWGSSTTTTTSGPRRRTRGRVGELLLPRRGRPRRAAHRDGGRARSTPRTWTTRPSASSSSCSPRSRSATSREETFEYPLSTGSTRSRACRRSTSSRSPRIDLDELGGGLAGAPQELIADSGLDRLTRDRPTRAPGRASGRLGRPPPRPGRHRAGGRGGLRGAARLPRRRGRLGDLGASIDALRRRRAGRPARAHPRAGRRRSRSRRRWSGTGAGLADDAHRPAAAAGLAVLAPLPLVIPSFVGAFALLAALAPRAGLARRAARPRPACPTSTASGARGSCSRCSPIPYVYLPVAARLAALPPSLEESARLLGRRPGRRVPHRGAAAGRTGHRGRRAARLPLHVSDFGAVRCCATTR